MFARWKESPLWQRVGWLLLTVLLGLALVQLEPLAEALRTALQLGVAQASRWHAQAPWGTAACFLAVFAALSAASMPGCSLLAVGAGAVYGPWWGATLVTVASAAGALVPFALARRFGRKRLRERFPKQFEAVDRGVQHAGLRYLLLLRLAPVIPYSMVNPLMGLTPMRAPVFFAVSAVGMWLGSAVYALAGAGLDIWANSPVLAQGAQAVESAMGASP